MIVQGIDYNDLMTTGARIGTWDDWCRAWCATAAGHEEFARKAEAEGNRESATESYLMASMAYHFGCNNSPQNLDEYIPAAKKRVECYAKAAPYLNPPALRHEVPFEHFRMASYLRVPSGITKPPVVMIISGLESTKEEARTMEDGFLRRGMATFTFDGPGQGESWFQGGLIVDFERATSAVIDYLEKLPGVDAGRIKEKQGARLVEMMMGRYVGGEASQMVWQLAREEWLARRLQSDAISSAAAEDRTEARRLLSRRL